MIAIDRGNNQVFEISEIGSQQLSLYVLADFLCGIFSFFLSATRATDVEITGPASAIDWRYISIDIHSIG